jgi:cytoskeletal protein RodZ
VRPLSGGDLLSAAAAKLRAETARLHTEKQGGAFTDRAAMSSLGSYLKRERERRQVSIAELAQTTRIPVRILLQLESDQHAELPAEVFVRGFLRSYARFLGVDEEHVLARYDGRELPESLPEVPDGVAPESGRRFGIAVALFILLILFTLALSIVLRPRHRDTTLELSRLNLPCPTQPTPAKLCSCARSTTPSPTKSSPC